MQKWYADDSELKKIHGEAKRPVLLFGGILISREHEIKLSNIIKEIKKEYTGEDMPVKFNLKDVADVYERFDRISEYQKLLDKSRDWRIRIIQESLKFDYTIFVSCIENFQADKKGQKEIRRDLSSFLFANALMRVGLYSAELKSDHVQVILDWPEGSEPNPFDKEYYYAYNRGSDSEGLEYFCGPLKQIGFDQTLYFARCNHSNMLQLADIILGSTRDWIETELQGRDYSIGKELAMLFLPKFYGYPKRLLGFGLNVSSKNDNFKRQLKEIINRNMA